LVPRLLNRRLGLATLTIALAAAAIAPHADAANRRISISNYQWSDPNIQINLGEHVTWYWVGPDVVHSVTGDSPNDAGVDSDPGNPLPNHPVGDSFQVSFSEPGIYQFRCKLHSSVRGTVTVSAAPGDATTEPDPVPPNRVDLKGPKVRKLRLDDREFSGRGTKAHFTLGEKAKLDADYFALGPHGKRTYVGFGKWKGYLGLNTIRFGNRTSHFAAKPGRYVAELRATDRASNVSKPRDIRFEVRANRPSS
jgi:plastocyanin